MVEIAEDIKIVEPTAELYEAYIKACGQMQTYLSDDTINDTVGKRETSGFIFAQDKYQVSSQEEFKDKIVDFYKNKRELNVSANNQALSRENSPELFYFITKGNEIIGSVNARPMKMDKFDRENGVKSCEKWHELSPETGVRVTTSTVILHQYKGHGYAGEAKKQLFDNLNKNGIKEVVANAMADNERSNKAQKKLVNNYGGFSYTCSGINNETGETIYANRYVVSTDTSGNSKKLYKDKNTEYVNTQVERIKSKITVKNIDDNKIGKTNTDRICELRGLSTPTQVPYKAQTISKENLQGLRYAYNSKLER